MRVAFALLLILITTCLYAQKADISLYQEAKELYIQGKYTESYLHSWQSLESIQLQYGVTSSAYAYNLRLLALITASFNQDSLALAFTLQEIRCWELQQPTRGRSLLEAYLNAANLYFSTGEPKKSENAVRHALVIADSLAVRKDSLTSIRFQAGRLYQVIDLHQSADSLFKMVQETTQNSLLKLQAQFQRWLINGKLGLLEVSNMMRILQQRGDTTTSFYFDLCYHRGNIAFGEANWQEAQHWLEVAREGYQQKSPHTPEAYASVLNNLGAIALADRNEGEGGYLIERAFQYRTSPVDYTKGSFWTAVNNLAAYYQEHSSPEEAKSLYSQYIHLEDSITAYPWQYAIALNNLATLYQDEGSYERAAQYFERSIEVLNNQPLASKNALLHQASVYNNVARNYQYLVRFDTAIFYHQKSLEIIKKAVGRESSQYVAAIGGMAAMYHDIGYWVEAEIFYQEAINIQEKLSGKQDNTYANLLSNYALVCQSTGNYAKAADLLETAIKIKEKLLGTEHPEYLFTLSNIGLLYLEEGKYIQARPMLELVAEVQREVWGVEHPSIISSYLNLARLEIVTGNYPEAEPLLQQAFALSVNHYGEGHSEQAKVQLELAKFYFKLGNFVRAKPLLLSCQKIFLAAYGASHPMLATAFQSLAALYEAQDSVDVAKQYYQQALTIDANTLGKQHPSYAATLSNLATLYQNNNEYQLALPLLQESLSINRKILGKDHPYYSTTLLNLGLLYQDLNELNKATEFIEEVVTVRRKILGELHPDFAYAQYSQAVLYHKLEQYNKAEEVFHQVVANYIRQIQNYFPSLSEQEKGAYYQRVEPVFHAFRDFVIDQVYYRSGQITEAQKQRLLAELYNLQLVTKAMLLDASYQLRQAIETRSESETVKEYERWLAVKEQLGQLYTLSRQERNDQIDFIRSLEEEANNLEKQLSRKSETFATTVENEQVTWDQVQLQLGPSEAAVEIIRVAQDSSVLYVALVLERNSIAPKLCVFPNGKEMENKNYFYYKNAIQFRIADDLSYDHFWQPIQEELSDGVYTVYVAPDGIYHKININSLYYSSTKKYVIDELNLRILSSTRDLVNPFIPQPTNSAYLLGSPNFQLKVGEQGSESELNESESTSLTASTMLGNTPFLFGIKDLPGTRAEVEKISTMLSRQQWRTHTYLGEQAREKMVKLATEPQVLHIASHGYFMTDLSGIGNSPRLYRTRTQNIAANPLLRSGLLLAGAEYSILNSPEWKAEDGILTAYEAMNLRLNGTELVVLSACETGLGDIINGEGVYGLQRSFLIAGAQSVMMSLWNVNDSTTAELMTLFYQNWLSGQSKHQALRQAQLSIKQQRADPYYWGGFVLVAR